MAFTSAGTGTITTSSSGYVSIGEYGPEATPVSSAGAYVLTLDLTNLPYSGYLSLRESIIVVTGGAYKVLSYYFIHGGVAGQSYVSLPIPVLYGVKYEYSTGSAGISIPWTVVLRA